MAKATGVKNASVKIQDPEFGQSIVDLGVIHDLEVTDVNVAFTMALTNLSRSFMDRMMGGAKQAVRSLEMARPSFGPMAHHLPNHKI